MDYWQKAADEFVYSNYSIDSRLGQFLLILSPEGVFYMKNQF
jgi:hypothetical protein